MVTITFWCTVFVLAMVLNTQCKEPSKKGKLWIYPPSNIIRIVYLPQNCTLVLRCTFRFCKILIVIHAMVKNWRILNNMLSSYSFKGLLNIHISDQIGPKLPTAVISKKSGHHKGSVSELTTFHPVLHCGRKGPLINITLKVCHHIMLPFLFATFVSGLCHISSSCHWVPFPGKVTAGLAAR